MTTAAPHSESSISETTTEAVVTLNAHQLTIGYERGRTALALPELRVTGHCIALLGRNGSGKSTLLKSLLGILAPRTGAIAARDESDQPISPQTGMAFCPEAGSTFLDVTVDEYLTFWERIRGKGRADRAELMAALGLTDLRSKRGKELSKGQRRRVHAAVGFLISPRLFLFDEPFDGLDIQHAAALVSLIERHAATTSFIISSHRLDIVERLCDSAIILRDGALVGAGSLSEVTAALQARSLADAMMR